MDTAPATPPSPATHTAPQPDRPADAPYRHHAVAGHPALDLCNTRTWRRDPARDIERIDSPGAFARWYGVAVDTTGGARIAAALGEDGTGGTDGTAPWVDPAVVAVSAEIRARRDELIAWLDAHVEGRSDEAAAAAVAGWYRAALDRAVAAPGLPLRWVIPGDPAGQHHAGDESPPPPGDAPAVPGDEPAGDAARAVALLRAAADSLALAAGDLLASADPGRIRRCAQPACGWFFLDASRNRSRRWCTPDDCGNLARVRAYAARQREAAR